MYAQLESEHRAIELNTINSTRFGNAQKSLGHGRRTYSSRSACKCYGGRIPFAHTRCHFWCRSRCRLFITWPTPRLGFGEAQARRGKPLRYIQKKRRPLIPVISLHELSQSVKSSQKGNLCRDKRINSSLYVRGGVPYINICTSG
jgi:hypothetical protein